MVRRPSSGAVVILLLMEALPIASAMSMLATEEGRSWDDKGDHRGGEAASMSSSLIVHMRERVAECRRLASLVSDERTASILRKMAEEGEADIQSAVHEQADGRSAKTSFEQLRALLPEKPASTIAEDHVLSLINARRGREALLGAHLFSDPAWDVILELYAARLGDRQMSVSGLARVMGAPKPVTARWIAVLVDAGIIAYGGSSKETGGATVELTEYGASKMAQLADQWRSAFVAI